MAEKKNRTIYVSDDDWEVAKRGALLESLATGKEVSTSEFAKRAWIERHDALDKEAS